MLKPPPPLRTSQGTWNRSNAEKPHAFAKHIADVFQPHPSENEPEEEEALIQLLESPYQLEPPIKRIERAEVQEVISKVNPKISSGYNLIIGKILKELHIIGIKYFAQLFSAVALKGYFPAQWKVALVTCQKTSLSENPFLRSVLRLLTANVRSSVILVTLVKVAIHSSETSVPTRAVRHHIPKVHTAGLYANYMARNYEDNLGNVHQKPILLLLMKDCCFV
jgi:hypothetical protein